MQHVNFYPWRGARYDTGINNKRILILGESHYCEDSDKSQKSRHRCPKEFDNYCMSCYMDRECHEKTIDTIVEHYRNAFLEVLDLHLPNRTSR